MPSDEFSYVSSVLICGERSSKTKQYKVFNLNIFKKHPDIGVKISWLKKGELRKIPLSETSEIRASVMTETKTQNFAPIITYVDAKNRIKISDTVFTSDEYDVYKKDIIAVIDRKVLATATLVEALYNKDISAFPLLINDFPNISKVILSKSSIIFK